VIETETDAVAVPHVVRAANRRTIREIHDEIRGVQRRPASSPQAPNRWTRLSGHLPGMVRRPAVEDGRIESREVLAVTVSVDHDVVDGAPAARFVRRLRALIEAADGLESRRTAQSWRRATEPAAVSARASDSGSLARCGMDDRPDLPRVIVVDDNVTIAFRA